MKTKLNLMSIEERTGKTGQKYLSVKTSQGTMACFDETAKAEIRGNIGKDADIDYTEKNGFKNIDRVNAVFECMNPPAQQTTGNVWEENNKSKMASIIMSYVTQLVIADKVKIEEFSNYAKGLMLLHKELLTIEKIPRAEDL